MSALKKELVTVKESLNQTILEKDVLQNAKDGLNGALSKVRVADWCNLNVKDLCFWLLSLLWISSHSL